MLAAHEEWKPAKPIAHPSLSEADAASLRAERLARQAQSYKLKDPPKIALVRWTTMQDFGPTVASCLRAEGFNVIGYGSGLEYPDGISPAQASAYNLADFECTSKYTMHPRFLLKWTADQWGVLYDYQVEWLTPCLKGRGFDVSAPPSRETYVGLAMQNVSSDWDPVAEVDLKVRTVEARRELWTACPQYPRVEEMWG